MIRGVTTIVIVDWWQLLTVIAGGLLLLWLALLATLWIAERDNPDRTGLRDTLRLLPDVIRLLRRLAADPNLPRGIRIRLGLLLGYLLLPVDLVPDFIPALGYADDAIIVALALRTVVRHAGPAALAQHWPGTPDGLRTVHRLAGLDDRALFVEFGVGDDLGVRAVARFDEHPVAGEASAASTNTYLGVSSNAARHGPLRTPLRVSRSTSAVRQPRIVRDHGGRQGASDVGSDGSGQV